MHGRHFLASFVVIAVAPLACRANDCSVAQPHPLTPPEIAMMTGKTAEAESLYRAEIAKTPGDEELATGLVRALLAEQKVDEAAATIQSALAKSPQSPVLLTALAAVQHRQGLPWEEEKTLNAAQAGGVCYARLHLELARYYRFNSYYASALRQIQVAHQLDPYDLQIWRNWMRTLPREQRIAELKKYLADHGRETEEARGATAELARLESEEGSNASSCRLVSQVTTTDIPFVPIMFNAELVRAWGLEVAFNDKKSHLVIDTGASGLYINSALAKRAGLKPITRTQSTGIGDNGPQGGYLTQAASIKIGGLEFKNCLVEVSDRRNVVGDDGLIGMDVFSQFAVTLDFPWRKLTLGPLPPYPGTAAAPVELNTEGQAPRSSSDSGPHDRYVSLEMADWMKIYRSGHDLIVPGWIDRKNLGLFMIDTGAQMSSLSPKAAAAVTKIRVDDRMSVHGIAGAVKKVYYANDVSVRFGQLEQKNARMTVFDLDGVSRGAGTEISGMLGADTLDVLVIHIDYRDGLMKFEYSPNRGYQHYR
ncbi:MAG TPA: aspartyl protease family protein [Silvibacterium sp.]|nr:aspartyl protease family protein [Silvibacterium sp.]